MSSSRQVRVGGVVVFDGDRCIVDQIIDGAVVLRDPYRRFRRVTIAELLLPAMNGGLAWFPDAEPSADAAGSTWDASSADEQERANVRADHVREVLTGYRSGDSALALPGEPRTPYRVGQKMSERLRAKAAELQVGVRSLERWIAAYRRAGEQALVDRRSAVPSTALRRLDSRWVDAARRILDEQIGEPKVATRILIQRINARVEHIHGAEVTTLPSESAAYLALHEMDRGRNTLRGSTARKRSNANRPQGAYGKTFASRPGEFVLLDTTPLNVFALNPVDGRWVRVDMTFALDLYSRCMLGMRLTPVSTKSIDIAAVLIEAMMPSEIVSLDSTARWPYHGVPETIEINTDRIAVRRFTPPGLLPESIVTDHGRQYVSEHLTSACSRMGITLQPSRIYRPTDKGQVERYFGTLDTFLQELPGYKGRDVSGRGRDPESEAVYTIPQLEHLVREWMATVYHLRPHPALVEPGLPNVRMSPADRFEQGIAISGRLRLPASEDILLEMLPVKRRQFNHYGVEIDGIRYQGPIVTKYRNRSASQYDKDNTWAFSVDPTDIRRIFFRDPEDLSWHALDWELKAAVDVPFSTEALEHAKRLAVDPRERGDLVRAVGSLLEAWGAGRHLTPAERRTSARSFAQASAAEGAIEGSWSLRGVQQRLEGLLPGTDRRPQPPQPIGDPLEPELWGDDDDEEELFRSVVGDLDNDLMDLM